MKRSLLFLVLSTAVLAGSAQPNRWQQHVKYVMDIDMNVATNQFTGRQKLEYTNNSPDTLTKVFYHLYFNAFQPGSMMDQRSRRQGTMTGGRGADWDPRVKDRIFNLKPDEIGYQKIISLKMNGKPQQFEVLETILEVKLDRPIAPGAKAVFDMDFEAQVPLQIRRSGRDNAQTTVRYSMSQWYPKLCEYDYEGWHPTPYVAREFYGVWGDYDVNISIDKAYVLGGTGYLQNANQVGYGYEAAGAKVTRPAGDKLTWRFSAPNVHDFMWAADPGYRHVTRVARPGVTLNLLYKPGSDDAAWERILDDAVTVLPFIEKTFGPYTFKQYSFIEGGDGGMEYPMGTLLASPGAWSHEWMHNWYQGILATNESLYAWMDEGFTSYADARLSVFLAGARTATGANASGGSNASRNFAQSQNYAGYYNLVKGGKEEPLTTHADHFNYNSAYSAAAYSKGAVFLEQLGYIIGADVRDKVLLEYYRLWKFKHPNAADFIRVAEKVSDAKLDWYKEYWVNSTKTIDYAFDSLWEEGGKTKIRLKRVGLMPMPIDLQLNFKDGSTELHYVPLDLMYAAKPAEDEIKRFVYPGWKWTNETYVIETSRKLGELSTAEIDPSQRMADVERKNNRIKI